MIEQPKKPIQIVQRRTNLFIHTYAALDHPTYGKVLVPIHQTQWSRSKYMPHIALDSDQLKQIFINMFINAIQAMPNGGAITVTAASVDLKESGAVITISDTGPGIPVEIIANIFDPFFTTKQTGTGLGLSIVHRIVNEHNGQIRVRSVHGSGTTFEIVLPVASDDSALRQRG